jgi:hypothetical protein
LGAHDETTSVGGVADEVDDGLVGPQDQNPQATIFNATYVFFNKNGGCPIQLVGHPALFGAIQTELWFLPDNVEIALFVNSSTGPTVFARPGGTPFPAVPYDPKSILNGIIGPLFGATSVPWCGAGQACAM